MENLGTANAASSTITYYLSTDATLSTTADTVVGSNTLASLDVSEEGSDSIELTAPDTKGMYYYFACVDVVSGEINSNNNCSASGALLEVSAPDLAVSSALSVTLLTQGHSFTLSATVNNIGLISSMDGSRLNFYYSLDNIIDAG